MMNYERMSLGNMSEVLADSLNSRHRKVQCIDEGELQHVALDECPECNVGEEYDDDDDESPLLAGQPAPFAIEVGHSDIVEDECEVRNGGGDSRAERHPEWLSIDEAIVVAALNSENSEGDDIEDISRCHLRVS